MFSSRLDWTLRPNALARLVERKRAAGARILDLTESNPTRVGLRYPADDILDAFSGARNLFYEPQPRGLAAARAAIAERHGVDAGRIFLCASTSEAYSWLFKLLCDPGDEVLVPRPSYPLLDYLAALESVKARPYPLAYHEGWWIDLDALRGAVTPRTRAILVVNPNNPTGSYVKRGELNELLALGIPLISDEVFAEFSFGDDPRRAATLSGVTDVSAFCLGGLSKVCGLPQMKAGWIILNDEASAARLELIADTYLSVGTPVQHALGALLAAGREVRDQIRARTAANLAVLRGAARPLDVEGGWYAVIRLPQTQSEEQWTLDLLEHADVLAQPGYFYDFESEAYLVVSLLTQPEIFRAGIERLREFL